MQAMQQIGAAARVAEDSWAPVRELRDSIYLLALTASSLGVYLGLGAVVVRLVASR